MRLELSKKKNLAAFKKLLIWLFYGSLLGTFLGFASNVSLLFDLLSHFRVQYLVIQLIGLSWLLRQLPTKKAGLLALLTVAALITNGILFWQYASPAPFAPRQANLRHLKLLQMNVLVLNKNYAKVQDIIQNSQADVVSLQEIDKVWFRELRVSRAFRQYPYRIEHLKAGNILLSKYPLENAKVVSFAEDKLGKARYRDEGGYILTQLNLKGKRISFMNLHPPVPLSLKYIRSYQQYLALLAQEKKNLLPDAILMGDLNTTPWSYYYRQYLKTLNLKDAKRHHYMPTWPTFIPVFFLPIDHVLVSPNIQTVSQKLAGFSGSDHFPVVVELQFPH
jgi:endonuclease/exonuclease/phosphatase (EEP) superfamily protein YafD